MSLYELTPMAESDLRNILEYTFKNFGKNQLYKYKEQLEHCLDQIAQNFSHRKIEIDGKNIVYLHCQKHYIFAQERVNQPLLILAVLHERMDFIDRIQNRL